MPEPSTSSPALAPRDGAEAPGDGQGPSADAPRIARQAPPDGLSRRQFAHSSLPAAAAYLALALFLTRGAWLSGELPGAPMGEQWGRLFVTAQASRWLTGAAPLGHADLAGAPDGVPFWPVDPATQLVLAPLSLLLGPHKALLIGVIALITLAGLGPYHLLRRLGAPLTSAFAAGLLVELAPYLLRNLHDLVLEVEAIGPVALAIGALLAAREEPRLPRLVAAGGAIALVALTSPYYAVYLALGCALVLPFDRARWRAWAGIALAGALAGALSLLPFALLERGPNGRLSEVWSAQGYQLVPGPLVDPRSPDRDLPRSPPKPRDPPPAGPPPPPEPAWVRSLHRFPGGLALAAAGLMGLFAARSRPFALLGLAFFFGGPGLTLTLRFVGKFGAAPTPPLLALLDALPLTSTLGNPVRMLSAWVLLAALAGGLAARRAPLALALLALALFETAFTLPGLVLPSSPLPLSPALAARVEGPVVVFPSGDPPAWHPAVGPKETLTVAALAQAPVASDYGRGATPADLGLQVWLATQGGVPIGRGALVAPPDPSPSGFSWLVLLEDRLEPAQVTALQAALQVDWIEVGRDDRAALWRRR